jgi:hypothetical protein
MNTVNFQKIGEIAVPDHSELKKLIRKSLRELAPGELSPGFFRKEFRDLVDPVTKMARGFGFITTPWPSFDELKGQGYLPTSVILPVRGSSSVHRDSDLNDPLMLLSWLVHCGPLRSFYFKRDYTSPASTLIAGLEGQTVVKEIHVGDIFIFNPRNYHVWVSNWECVLIQFPVFSAPP